MKRLLALVLVLLTISFAPGSFGDESEKEFVPPSFNDLEWNHTFHDSIQYLASLGVLEGYADGSVQPRALVNRVEALKMILEWSGVDVKTAELDFVPSDLDPNAWYYPYVTWGVSKGIVDGYEDGLFRPYQEVNLAEVLKMLVLAKQVEYTDFCVENCQWFSDYELYAINHQLITPNWDGVFDASTLVERGTLAEILYRMDHDLYTGYSEYGVATYYGYSWNGANTASGTPLNTYSYQAAHKTLPFGTLVKVTNLDNGLSTVVEIVDRGPYGEGRIIDLTPHAFDEIGALSSGVLRTQIEVLK